MIIVKVELHSAVTGKTTTLGRMVIDNVGGTEQRGNYRVRVGNKADADDTRAVMERPQRTGGVLNYPRISYNVWRLVVRALLSAFPEEAK